jgi:uncharacterized protein with PIN domain
MSKRIKTAKTCSHCRDRIIYPFRGSSFVVTHKDGNEFRHKLCPKCYKAGWRFYKDGTVILKKKTSYETPA